MRVYSLQSHCVSQPRDLRELIGVNRTCPVVEIRKEIKRRTYQRTAEGIEIRIAQLGDDAGLLGAGLAAIR